MSAMGVIIRIRLINLTDPSPFLHCSILAFSVLLTTTLVMFPGWPHLSNDRLKKKSLDWTNLWVIQAKGLIKDLWMVKELNFPQESFVFKLVPWLAHRRNWLKNTKRFRRETNRGVPIENLILINICLMIDHRRYPLGNLRLGENIDQIFTFRNV